MQCAPQHLRYVNAVAVNDVRALCERRGVADGGSTGDDLQRVPHDVRQHQGYHSCVPTRSRETAAGYRREVLSVTRELQAGHVLKRDHGTVGTLPPPSAWHVGGYEHRRQGVAETLSAQSLRIIHAPNTVNGADGCSVPQ